MISLISPLVVVCFQDCKRVRVVPVFRSETRMQFNSYFTLVFLESQNYYYHFQFGFSLNFSTNNVLMSIVENIQSHLDTGQF